MLRNSFLQALALSGVALLFAAKGITQPIDESKLVTLAGNTSPEANSRSVRRNVTWRLRNSSNRSPTNLLPTSTNGSPPRSMDGVSAPLPKILRRFRAGWNRTGSPLMPFPPIT
jgi:hypothetical protein